MCNIKSHLAKGSSPMHGEAEKGNRRDDCPPKIVQAVYS